MLRSVFLLGIFAASACTPSPPRTAADFVAPLATPKPQSTPSSIPTPAPTSTPIQKKLPLAYYHTSRSGVILSLVSFDDRDHHLRVADQPNGLGSRWTTAQGAAATYGGLAAINGGFFTPEGKPLGLLIETGTRRAHVNKSSLGAGYYMSSPQGDSLVRRGNTIPSGVYNLLQTGPMLAERAKTISGLSKNNRRPRSFIAWDGQHHWAIGYAEPCTLHNLSTALAGSSPAGFRIHTAINLDGGRSSDLWVGSEARNGGKTHRTYFNKPVRNYLVLKKRHE